MSTEAVHYIAGTDYVSAGSEWISVVDPSTEDIIGRVARGTTDDVGRAVTAARAAFDRWSQTQLHERTKAVMAIGRALAAHHDECASLIAHELGMPLGQARDIQCGMPINTLASAGASAEKVEWTQPAGWGTLLREPVGVVVAITPWNYPLHQIALKLTGALVAGCTIVLKPSEITPLSAAFLTRLVESVGLPPGVFNVVHGVGSEVGEALVQHPEVDMISFTGSTRAGVRISQLAAPTVKRVSLELGGKSASVVLDDADLEAAVSHGMRHCCLNSGQTCSALTRVLVPRPQLGEAEEIAREVAESIRVGDALDPDAEMGPLVSASQRERVLTFIDRGRNEGARLLAGGDAHEAGLDRGYFVLPALFTDATSDMAIAQEEIFGPVLTLIPHDSDEDALRIANDSRYGLSGRVWSADEQRAWAVARRMRTGQVYLNAARGNPAAPFGGYKQSGGAREGGRWGIEEYLVLKAVTSGLQLR